MAVQEGVANHAAQSFPAMTHVPAVSGRTQRGRLEMNVLLGWLLDGTVVLVPEGWCPLQPLASKHLAVVPQKECRSPGSSVVCTYGYSNY